ncbi:MAG: pyruvate kinase [Holosporales bacterium]
MRRLRSTKVVATLGPSSTTPEVIEKMLLSGVDVFRLNFSHGSHDDHAMRFHMIRDLAQKHAYSASIMMDLQGPKLRLGTFAAGKVQLSVGDRLTIDMDPTPGTQHRVCLPHPEIFAALRVGAELLLDDGKVRLKVLETDQKSAVCQVLVGGVLSDRKGVNVPDVSLPISALTPKDREDLAFGLELGVDWVALSFVQRPEDIEDAKKLIGENAGIIAKLEKPQAIDHLDQIVRLSDAVMVARGDLGVEMAPEDVPAMQKRIISTCRALGRPVIVATQMLESMIHAPTPTRAEASDVANAVYDGVDAVMLSAESASGSYPLEAVQMMDRIIKRVEADPLYRCLINANATTPDPTPSDAITLAARQVAHTVSAKAIVNMTTTGSTTLRTARERPEAVILALTPSREVASRLTLVWGVLSVHTKPFMNMSDALDEMETALIHEGIAAKGQLIVLTAGTRLNASQRQTVFAPGSTRVLRVHTVGEDDI